VYFMWTSTRGGGRSSSCGRMWIAGGGKNPDFLVDIINGSPHICINACIYKIHAHVHEYMNQGFFCRYAPVRCTGTFKRGIEKIICNVYHCDDLYSANRSYLFNLTSG